MMKRLLTLLTTCLLLTATSRGATTIDKDSLRYSLDADAKTATLTKCLSTSRASVAIPQTVKEGSVTYTVTAIGDYAFDQHKELTSVTFPSTITQMGFCSFRWCSNLTSVTLPSSLKSVSSSNFSECWRLKSVTLPSGLEKIEEAGFYNCDSLQNITLPDNVTEIGANAFFSCEKLRQINTPSKLTTISRRAFCDCRTLQSFTLPASMTAIENETFRNCYEMQLTGGLPSGLLTIGESAFCECRAMSLPNGLPSGLQTIKNDAFYGCNAMQLPANGLPSSLTSIGDNAFKYCWGLVDLSGSTLSNLESMGHSVFAYCTSLTKGPKITSAAITKLPNYTYYECPKLISQNFSSNITTIGYACFYRCGLRSLTIPSTVTSVENYAFEQCDSLLTVNMTNAKFEVIPYKMFSESNRLRTVTFPQTLKTIEGAAFYNCDSLQTVNLKSTKVETIGEDAFSSCDKLKTVVFPTSTLKSLGTRAFCYCSSLEMDVVIPQSVTSIGNNAFDNCKKIKSFKFPDNLETMGTGILNECDSMTLVVLPKNIKTIAGWTCQNCDKLQTVVMGNQTETIGRYAFYYCKALTDISLPSSLKTIEQYAFNNCTSLTSVGTVPATLTSIGEYAFENCTSLEAFNIPASANLTTIESHAFGYCKSLKSITFPNALTEIKQEALRDTGIEHLVFNQGLQIIGTYAFYNCQLTSIDFPSTLTTLNKGCFQNCKRLKTLELPESLTSLGQDAFNRCDSLYSVVFPENSPEFVNGGQFYMCYLLSKVTLPKHGMKKIPNSMFYQCYELRAIDLPDEIETISSGAFQECKKLRSIYIPDNVTTIEDRAFETCSNLEYVRLPEGLTTIPYCCFDGCNKLVFLNIPSTVTELKSYAVWIWSSSGIFKSLGMMGGTPPTLNYRGLPENSGNQQYSVLVPASTAETYNNTTNWAGDHYIEYPATKQTLTSDKIKISMLDEFNNASGGPQPVVVDWFEGMGNYRVYYTDSKGNRTTTAPDNPGNYKISLVFEEGPYYKAATFNNVATFKIQEIADEDFALLWDFYSKTYDWDKPGNYWTGSKNGKTCNWKLIKDRKESAADIYGVDWENGHVTAIKFGTGTGIDYISADDLPASVFALPQVRSIDMTNCHLKGDIGKKVEEYLAAGNTLSPTLEELIMPNNSLEGNISTLANALPALKTLNVQQNKFSTVYPALPATIETLDISKQTISNVSNIDLTDMTEAGFFSTLPSIIFYNPETRTYEDNITINIDYSGLYLNYEGENTYNVTGNAKWTKANGAEINCYYKDKSNNTTSFKANFSFPMGDTDFNGEVDVLDLQKSIYYLLRDSYQTRINFTAGDFNSDNKITVLDIVPQVDVLLANNKPAAIEAKARDGQDDNMEPCEAKLYVKDGALVLNSSKSVAAIDMILSDTDVSIANATLGRSMTSVKRQTDDDRLHLIIYSTNGTVIPAGETVLGRCADTMRVGYAKLADEEAAEISVSLNMPDAQITTSIKDIELTDIDTDDLNWEIHSIDGKLLSRGKGKLAVPNGQNRGMVILTYRDSNGTIVKSSKIVVK